MYYLVSFLAAGFLVLGAVLCLSLIGVGGASLPSRKERDLSPLRIGGRILSVEEAYMSLTLLVMGTVWSGAWLYFMSIQDDSLHLTRFQLFLQLLTAVSLLGAGVAILRKWNHWRGIYLTAVAATILSFALVVFAAFPRPSGEPDVIYILGGITFVIVGGLTVLLYILDRSLLHRQQPQEKKG